MSDLRERLRALVILDEVRSDNQLGREAADEIDKLEARLAEEKAKHALTIQHADQVGAWLASARKALEHVRGIIVDAAMVGFNYKEGDWAERLFASQQMTKAALTDEKGES